MRLRLWYGDLMWGFGSCKVMLSTINSVLRREFRLVFHWYRSDTCCNHGCASFSNSAPIFANFLHLCVTGYAEFSKCDVVSVFILIHYNCWSWCSCRTNHGSSWWILKLEFVEMYELLPETWLRDDDESGKGVMGLHR